MGSRASRCGVQAPVSPQLLWCMQCLFSQPRSQRVQLCHLLICCLYGSRASPPAQSDMGSCGPATYPQYAPGPFPLPRRSSYDGAGYGDTTVIHDSGTVVVHHGGGGEEADPSQPAFHQLLTSGYEDAEEGGEGEADAQWGSDTVVVRGGAGEPVRSAGGGSNSSQQQQQQQPPAEGGEVSSYWAAVQAAAVDFDHQGGGGGGGGGGAGHGPGGGQSHPSPLNNVSRGGGGAAGAAGAAPRDALQRTKERLLSAYDGGLVVPVPFLPAAGVQPLALLDCLAARGGRSGQAPPAASVDFGLLPTASGGLEERGGKREGRGDWEGAEGEAEVQLGEKTP